MSSNTHGWMRTQAFTVTAFGVVAVALEAVLPMHRYYRTPLSALELGLFLWLVFRILRCWWHPPHPTRTIAFEAASMLSAALFLDAKARILFNLWVEPDLGGDLLHASIVYSASLILALLLGSVARSPWANNLGATFVASPSRVMVLSFALAMLVGTIALSLPISVRRMESVSVIDALFTATSAVCVTGLAVNDIGTTYTRFGHVVILLLIQVGGLGIMTLGTTIFAFAGRQFRVRQAASMAEMLDAESLSSMRHLVRRIVLAAVLCESLGAAALHFAWRGDLGDRDASWFYSIFHAVSAMCNAGFSLFPDNLTAFASRADITFIIASLIFLGGIGFPVLDDVARFAVGRLLRRPRRRLRLHSRIALHISMVLVVAGTVLTLLLEWNASLAGLPIPTKILASFFHSVSSRTAGFNVTDMGKLTSATLLFTMVLMFIGASPASTGGGIKTTTAAVFVASLRSTMRGRSKVEVGDRTLPDVSTGRALTVIAGSTTIVVVAAFVLFLVDKHEPLHLLFEACSAFGTVGLSAGITASLTVPAKVVLVLVMLIGRVGPLTIALALGEASSRRPIAFPEERVLIG